MYHHVKKPMYTVRVDVPDPAFGNMLLEQFGGANGELAAAMQYSIQGLNCDDMERKDLLMDIGTEELSHLEIVGALARLHLKPMKFDRDAAEARAKIVYERLINFTDDAGTKDALQFLMTREITHTRRRNLSDREWPRRVLPKMERAAHAPRLKQAFADHLEETQGQVERLKEVFVLLGEEAKPKPCKGMAGLIEEGQEVIEEGEEKDAVASDLALIASAQKVEHYEISAYGTARSLAGQAGLPAASMLLSTSLAEEEIADNLLTQIARELMSESGDTAIRDGGEPETKERRFNAPQGDRKGQGKAARSKSH